MSGTGPATLRIATRESRLALWQAQHVRSLLAERLGLTAELVGMTTTGDRLLDRTLAAVGGKGLFVKELEQAMEEGRADLAVHSLKDVPMELPAGFAIVAVLPREDARDAFVSPRWTSLAALPQGARVGTASLRRMAQLRALRPDLRVEPVRGNLDTRLRKLDEGAYDALVLAAAGLERLELQARIREVFEPERMLPCAGQGALAIEARAEATALCERLAALDHQPTHLAALAERAVSRALGGSCTMPLAAHGTWNGKRLRLRAALGDAGAAARPLLRVDDEAVVADAQAAEALGLRVAAQLREAGAAAYLAA